MHADVSTEAAARWRPTFGVAAAGLFLLELVVCLSRQLFLPSHSFDADQYELLLEHFRGHETRGILAPFAYRPLAPFVASLLPLAPRASMHAVNLLALAGAVYATDRLLLLRRASDRARLVAALLGVVSFPSFYYLSIGLVDPAAIFFVALGTWAMLADVRWLTVLAVLLGALTKESTGVVLLAVALSLRRPAWFAVLVGVFLAGTVIARTAIGLPPWFVWAPSGWRIGDNLTRARMWLSVAMSLGLPALLAIRSLVRERPRAEDMPLLFGAGAALVVTVCAVGVAHADGRPAWLLSPFAIALAFRERQTNGQSAA